MKIVNKIAVVLSMTVLLIGCNYSHKGYMKTDPEFKKQWYLYNDGQGKDVEVDKDFCSVTAFSEGVDIDCMGIWETSESLDFSKEIVVAIIDTGVDYEHEELKEVMWVNEKEIPDDGIDNDGNGYVDDIYGWNFCEETGDIKDYSEEYYENDHGTMCAGIIAAKHNGIGIEGISRNGNVKIMSLKVLSGLSKNGTTTNIIKAIKYAESMGVKICNMSFNITGECEELERSIMNSDMLFVVSAGNDGKNIDEYKSFPASYKFGNLITVGNLDSTGGLYEESNWGCDSVDILAPGTNIYSCVVNGYGYDTGSSMSTPMVTGVAAMLWLKHEEWDSIEIKSCILRYSDHKKELFSKVRNGTILNGGNVLHK